MHRTIVTPVVQEPKCAGDSDAGVALGVLVLDVYSRHGLSVCAKQLSYFTQQPKSPHTI